MTAAVTPPYRALGLSCRGVYIGSETINSMTLNILYVPRYAFNHATVESADAFQAPFMVRKA
jgi:hypothetical protein